MRWFFPKNNPPALPAAQRGLAWHGSSSALPACPRLVPQNLLGFGGELLAQQENPQTELMGQGWKSPPNPVSHLAESSVPTSTPLPGSASQGAARLPRASCLPPSPAQMGFWGQDAFLGSPGPGRSWQHAENKRHLPHLCFPGEALARGEERERNSSVCQSVQGSSALGGSSQTGSPLAGPPCSVQPCWSHSQGTEPPPSAPAPCWENFPCAWKALRASGSQEQLQALHPVGFPPAGTSGFLLLLNSHCFLHWDGLKYSRISQRFLRSGKEQLQGGFQGRWDGAITLQGRNISKSCFYCPQSCTGSTSREMSLLSMRTSLVQEKQGRRRGPSCQGSDLGWLLRDELIQLCWEEQGGPAAFWLFGVMDGTPGW